jgi:hypothetical protein
VIPPILLLCLLLGVTAAASIADALARHARARRLSALAGRWDLRFTPEDRFGLTPRVAAEFPTPGAADVVVRDLVYGQEAGGGLRYLFTIEYTVGVLRTKRRRSAVGMAVEAASGGSTTAGERHPLGLALAPATLPTIEQYEWLWKQHGMRRASSGAS